LAVTLAAVVAASSPAAALAQESDPNAVDNANQPQAVLPGQTPGSSGGSVDNSTPDGAVTPVTQTPAPTAPATPAPAPPVPAPPAPAPAPAPVPAPAPAPPPPAPAPPPPPPPVQAAAPTPPPAPTVVASKPQRDTGVKEPASVAVAPQAPVAAPVPEPAPVVAPQPHEVVAVAESHATGSVKVQQGDSLWSIAQDRLGADATPQKVLREVDRLWSLNDLQDPDVIYAGQHLRT
jgi:hypothetical protein